MSTSENRRIIENVFAENAKGNGQPFFETLADDVQWTIIGTTAWSKTHVGKAAIVSDLVAPLGAQLAPPMIVRAHRIHADGDFVIVEGKGANKTRNGTPYENTYCWVIRMKDGRMAEVTEYADTQLIATALSPPGAPA